MALDPERLLWVPGRKRIFLSSARALSIEDVVRRYQLALIRQMTAEMEQHFLNGTSPKIVNPRGLLTVTLERRQYLGGAVPRDEAQP